MTLAHHTVETTASTAPLLAVGILVGIAIGYLAVDVVRGVIQPERTDRHDDPSRR